jgi:chromosomal replication initiation ATPase DnaA
MSRHDLEKVTIQDVAGKVARASGITEEQLLHRSRGNRRSEIRKVFAYLCYREFGFPITEIARYFKIAHSPASLSVRGGEILAKTKKYAKVLTALRP